MGMDVYGKAATSEAGEYFRSNIWGWGPLADYITAKHPMLASGCKYWHSNDGDGLDAEGSVALGNVLEADLASGRVARYIDARARIIAALPRVTCHICDGAGVRSDEVGVRYGFDKPRDSETGLGGCNGCEGSGTREHPAAGDILDMELLEDFAAFLKDCGGFQIW